MKKFTSLEDAFKWWLENIYPKLDPDVKKGELTYAWRDFKHKGSISEKRMTKILSDFGILEVKTVVFYTPK